MLEQKQKNIEKKGKEYLTKFKCLTWFQFKLEYTSDLVVTTRIHYYNWTFLNSVFFFFSIQLANDNNPTGLNVSSQPPRHVQSFDKFDSKTNKKNR